jgi:lysophospholipase L1-like esterase
VRGCWVLALGTNDTADVFVGSALDRVGRINKMMTLLAGQPVLWVNVKTRLGSGPYAEANMQAWNAAVLQACARYRNMRIYDWAAVVQNSWFISDGIHYTSYGYVQRARHIADALVHAFPAGGDRHPGCVVS